MTRNNSNPMLNSAGSETAKEKSRVRMPLADLTNRSTRPTRKTRITRSNVGDTKYCSMYLAKASAEKEEHY